MELLKKLRDSIFIPSTMSGLAFWNQRPLVGLRELHEIEHAAEYLKLKGWLQMNYDGSIQGHLEGTRASLQEFLIRLESGKIMPLRLTPKFVWLPHKDYFASLKVRPPKMDS